LKKLGSLFSYIFGFLFNLLPWSANRLFAKLLAFLWLDIFNIRREVIFNNLQIAFPEMNTQEKEKIAKASLLSMCRSFFDVIRVPYLNDAWIDKNVIFEGSEFLEQMRNEPGGFFILTLHLGSGDLAAAIISQKIRPVTLISKRFTNTFLDAFWFGLRERSKTNFIDAHARNNAFDILSSLKQNRGVVFVLDQFMGRPYGVESEFFGVKTGTAYGLALFAKKTKKPVYPIYTYWGLDNKLHIGAQPAIDLSHELGENNQVITNKFNKVLENIINQHPEHWMWVHKRWKTFE
jgi:Kdo2-lipid IVA lauroyltransferase/acyltransferase